MQFISAYSKKTKPKSITYPPTKTKQSMQDECDINKIIQKYSKIGVLEHVNNNQPSFGDITDVDFQQSLNLVIDAQQAFDGLPSVIRQRFANDPALLLQFLNDESNKDEAIRLGLIPAPVVAEPPPRVEGSEPPKAAEEPVKAKEKA